MPWLINFKEKVIETVYGAGKKPANHHLMTINVMHREELETLGRLYQKIGKNLPLYIVHEGLLPYFSREEKIEFRDNMKWFLKKYAPGNGYWVTMDLSPVPGKKEKSSGVFKTISGLLVKATKRRHNFAESREETEQFLKEGGLQGEKLINSGLEKELSILDKVNIPGDIALEFNRDLCAYRIRPLD